MPPSEPSPLGRARDGMAAENDALESAVEFRAKAGRALRAFAVRAGEIGLTLAERAVLALVTQELERLDDGWRP